MRSIAHLARLGIAGLIMVGAASLAARLDVGSGFPFVSARALGAQPQATARPSVDWPMHNLDLRNSRFAALEDINTANASQLMLKWSFDLPREQTIGQVTPLVV